jgi:diguanylate cyclase (GGDEF)-like protein
MTPETPAQDPRVSSRRARGWPQRLGDAVLGTHPAQRIAIRVALSGLMAQTITLVLLEYAGRTGLLPLGTTHWLEATYALTVAAFYVLLRSGLSRRFSDVGMALPQIMAFIVWSLIGYVAARAVHAGMLMFVVITLAYGGFALDRAGVRKMIGYTAALLLGAMAWKASTDPAHYPWDEEGAYLVVTAIAMAILTWLTIQLAEFRGHLRTQKGELTDALKKIEEVATHDALTGAYNRRYMQELLEHHARLSQRSARGFAVAVLDLDHFKRVNDTHGHAAGDNVLKGFALSVQQHLQDTEVLARWGGEEFLLLAPDAGAAELAQAIDRVRQTLSHAVLCAGVPDLRVGVSAGVAYLQAGETVPQVIERADRALYAAKAAGRGRTVVDGGSAPQGAAS